ncbi:hypothetical protein, partial [Streptomyces exfoliatus]|uniref:hypothetical protein n=1 Tax=Streptomyces exfoliatus TaxID=1905 RepID=UPI00055EB659
KITDPVGNIWSTTYDQMGRPIKESDPAKGKSTTVYDDRGQVTSTTDARNTTLVNVYDNLGRRTAVYTGSVNGPLRGKWTYDTVTGAKGKIAESTRYENGEAYTTKVTAYDRLYRPYRTSLTIPASEKALAGTYQTGTTYKPSGLPASTTYSAAGALPGGTVSYGYEDQTLRQNSIFGQGMSTSTVHS